MKSLRQLFISMGVSMVISVLLATISHAQIPEASPAQKEGCYDGQGHPVNCGEKFVVVYQGITYDCICNCSGKDDCTPRSGSDGGGRGAVRGRRETSEDDNNDNAAAVEAERAKRAKEAELLEKARKEAFELEHNNLMHGLKGSGTSTPVLKTGNATTSNPLGLKTGVPSTSGDVPPPAMRRELTQGVVSQIQARTATPSDEGQDILRSLRTNKPPSPVRDPAHEFDNLKAGDVILVGKIPINQGGELGWTDMAISQLVNFADRLASHNYTSEASHVAVFLGEKNGKRWFLNNTSEHGPVIIEEKEFMRLYGERKMDYARLIGKPIGQEEAEKIWDAAHEQRNTKKYGIRLKDRMVCSESAYWALTRTGRVIPERRDKDIQIFGTSSYLNKDAFVDFSPADFYDSWQYFVVRPLDR